MPLPKHLYRDPATVAEETEVPVDLSCHGCRYRRAIWTRAVCERDGMQAYHRCTNYELKEIPKS